MSDRLKYVRVGMRNNGASVKLKLRWDHSPATCKIVSKALPFEGDMWHAKYANHEIYTLVPVEPVFGEDPPKEWLCMFPAPGDLMYIFHPDGLLPPESWTQDSDFHIVDIALFYDRGNNLYGPSGGNTGNIFATAADIDELERFAAECIKVWKSGFWGERMYVEAVE